MRALQCVWRGLFPKGNLINNRKRCSNGLFTLVEPKESTVEVNGVNINYLRVGMGHNTVLCLPGALGTIWSDFGPQIKGLDKERLTLVVWDPPGYGLSRPPNKTFDTNFYKNDAQYAIALMKELGYQKYSLLGWSDGGITGMIMAARDIESVDKLIIWGANAFITADDIAKYEKVRDVGSWSEKMREPLEKLYTREGLQEMMSSWCDAMVNIHKAGGDICKNEVSKIRAKTLVIHGTKDPLVPQEHANFLSSEIINVRRRDFPEGKHNLHLKFSKEFNSLVEEFLLE